MMAQLPDTFFLAVATVEELGREYREQAGSGVAWTQLLWFIIPIGLIAACVIYYRKSERLSNDLKEADGLLAELYESHQFTGAARSLCNRISDTCDLSDPAVIMVSPSVFEKAVSKARQVKPFSARQNETLDGVRQQLFGNA
jgi:hypothetical protein